MTVDEIFSKIFEHMLIGIQFHDDMVRAHDYLNLNGLSLLHVYHAREEKDNYLHLSHYYLSRYAKLLSIENLSEYKIIPETWYKYSTYVVDNNTKRNAIKELMEKWIKWEQETKKLYQEMRQELTVLGEIAAALYIDQYIIDVDEELHDAQKKLIRLETINYDLVEITNWQEHLYKKYKKKLGW